jgi:DNA-binding SARP family transcriptional activator
MLDVRLAGGFELRVDGAPIALPASRRARAVLAYLALNPGPQPRGRLAARFWPDVLDESARASLRVALTELRQALGPAARFVVATRDTVALEARRPPIRRATAHATRHRAVARDASRDR